LSGELLDIIIYIQFFGNILKNRLVTIDKPVRIYVVFAANISNSALCDISCTFFHISDGTA